MAGRTVFDAALRLAKLDSKEGLKDNSLAIAFSGGHGHDMAQNALADLRLLIRSTLHDGSGVPTTPFGDSAA